MNRFWSLMLLTGVTCSCSRSSLRCISEQFVYGRLFIAGGWVLVVVILLLIAVLVMLKRFNGKYFSAVTCVLSSVSVGQRERAVLVQVGEQQMLLGVGPGNVRTLHVFDKPAVSMTAAVSRAGMEARYRKTWSEQVNVLKPVPAMIAPLLPNLAAAQTIPLVTSSPMANGDTEYALGIQILMVMTVLTLLPAMLITMTAFTRILIALAILRQALGTAQTLQSDYFRAVTIPDTVHHVARH